MNKGKKENEHKKPTVEHKNFHKNKLKIFKTLQKQYANLGISSSSQQTTQKYPFNERVIHCFLFFGWLFVSHFVYIFHVANGFMEYVQGICTTCASMIVFVCFTSKVFNETKLFESIANIENLINKSEPYIFM